MNSWEYSTEGELVSEQLEREQPKKDPLKEYREAEAAKLPALAQARWELLQYITRDWKCFNPDQYGRDCGKCLRCVATYKDGALEWQEQQRNKERR